MEFLDVTQSWMTERRSRSPWTNPNLDLIAERALLDAQIFKDTAAAALKEKVRLEDLRLAKIKQDELEKANIAAGLNADGSVKTGDPEGGAPAPAADLLAGKELVVIRNGEVITIGLNGRSMEDAIAEEMAIPGTEAASKNIKVGINPPEAVDLTPEQQAAWDTFEENFEGLEGMDILRGDIFAGNVDPLDLPDVSFFNNQIRDAAGILPGGVGAGGGFYNTRSTPGYQETYADEPAQNPVGDGGAKMWVENADGTGWIRNTEYVVPGSVGSESSIAKTIAATDAEAAAEAAKVGAEGATAILTRLVGAFGLPVSVVAKLKKMMVDGLSEEAIALEIRQEPEYGERFPGMKLRQDAGFASMSEADYMANEDAYQELLRTHGLPEKFYDDRMDFATLIAADVSPNEFAERVTLAELATAGADPKTKEELKRLFDVDQADLVAYYLDPEGATNLIEERRAFEAAGLSATGARVLGQTIGFDKDTALALQRESIQRREVQQRLSTQTGLVTQLLGEQDQISASDLVSSEFGLDPEAKNKVRRRREGRVAGFAGQSGMLISGTGATGLGSST